MRFLLAILFSCLLGLSVFGQQHLTVGAPAPDFAAETLDGQFYSLNNLQGKVVVITFWSTKCAICHSEIPKLNRLVERYKGQDVVFLAITMENNARVEPYLKKNPFNFSIVPNSFGVVLKYADMDAGGRINMGFPSYFLINRRGAIALRSDGWDKTASIDAQISRLLSTE